MTRGGANASRDPELANAKSSNTSLASYFVPYQRNMDIEGMGGCYAERAWGEH